MTIKKKREALKAAYPDEKWAAKIDAMTDKQILATYDRLKSQEKV